jgi:hypothetical protein
MELIDMEADESGMSQVQTPPPPPPDQEEVVLPDLLRPRNEREEMYAARAHAEDRVLPMNWVDKPRFANPSELCQALKYMLEDGDGEEALCPYPYDRAIELINSHMLLCHGRVYFKYQNLELGATHNYGTLLREFYDAIWNNANRHDRILQPGFVDWISFPVGELNARFPAQPFVLPIPAPHPDEPRRRGPPVKRVGIFQFWLKSLCHLETMQVFHHFVNRTRWDIRNLPVVKLLRMTSQSFSEWRGFKHWHHFDDLEEQLVRYGRTPHEIYQRHSGLRRLFNHIFRVLCSSHQPSCWAFICTLAQILQRPGDKTEKIIQFPGPQGAGKSMIIYAIVAMLMGPGASSWITRQDDLFGDFNEAGLGNSPRLIAMDEFSFMGHRAEAVCNNCVSAASLQVNGKFKTPRTVYGNCTIVTVTNRKLSIDVRKEARRHLICRVSDLINKFLLREDARRYFRGMVDEVLTQDTFFALATLLEILPLQYFDENHRGMDLSNMASSEARVDGWKHSDDPEEMIYLYLLDCIKSEVINEATRNRAVVHVNLFGVNTPPASPGVDGEPIMRAQGPLPEPWMNKRVTSHELYNFALANGLDGNKVKHVDFRKVVTRTLGLKESRNLDGHIFYSLPMIMSAKASFRAETGVDIDELQADELRSSQANRDAPPIPMDWALFATPHNSVKLRDIFLHEVLGDEEV